MKAAGKRALVVLLIGCLSLAGPLAVLNSVNFPGHRELKQLLMRALTKAEPLPVAENQVEAGGAAYVLGGSPESLRARFNKVAALYRSGVVEKVLIGSDDSMMAFDQSVQRNLTLDEWMIRRLAALGLREGDIELVSLSEGFFGTYQEAKGVSAFVAKSGYSKLILVTSSYHTARTWNAFSRFIGDHKIDLYIYPAEDHADLRTLLVEYSKLNVYRGLLLGKQTSNWIERLTKGTT